MQKLEIVDGRMLVVHLASEAKFIETGVLDRKSYPKYFTFTI